MDDRLKIQHFPENGLAAQNIDWMNLQKVYYTGLYERFIMLEDGTKRSYKVYVPVNARYDDDTCYLAVPDGVETADFLLESGWLDIADEEKNHVLLYVFEPSEKVWGSPKTELEYIRKAFFDMYSARDGLRSWVYTNDFNWRWAGYGAGGEMLQRYAMENPMMFASLAVVDGSEKIEKAYCEACAEICFKGSSGRVYSEWPNKHIPVPVWLVGRENQTVTDHWRQANECTDDRLELADGYRYDQNPLSANLMTFDQKVGQVTVTPKAVVHTDRALTKKIFHFIMQFSRCGTNSPYANMLYNNAGDDRFQRQTMVIDGMEREWFVNVPANYDPNKPMPLVIYFHGTGQSGLIAMRQGGWWQYGEEKGFITVCPSGSLEQRGAGHVPIVIWNIGSPVLEGRSWVGAEKTPMEERFVRTMIDALSAQYNIDKTRMYITGQSNGGRMTQMMSERAMDLFAAAVSNGSTAKIGHTRIPDMSVGGEYDMYSARIREDDLPEDEKVRAAFKEAVEKRGLIFENPRRFTNGIFDNLIWLDGQGIPAYRHCCVIGQAHSWRQSAVKMYWDEWFCRFSRDSETGRICYMGNISV